jgi:hypothetical protein
MKCYYQTINKDLLPTKSKILVHLVLSNMGIKTAVFVQIQCIQRLQNVAMWNITCTTFCKTQLKGGGEGGSLSFVWASTAFKDTGQGKFYFQLQK